MGVFMIDDIVEYWFSERIQKLWFNSTAEFDQELKERYEQSWIEASQGKLDNWLDSPRGCLAMVILLDQFPLNMFRGQAASFSTEAQSREVAAKAIERGFDYELPVEQRSFIYMPFMHSESLRDQDLAIQYFDQKGLEGNHRFANHHRGIIEKFGRFPHRNDILGRTSSPEEIEYLNSKDGFKG